MQWCHAEEFHQESTSFIVDISLSTRQWSETLCFQIGLLINLLNSSWWKNLGMECELQGKQIFFSDNCPNWESTLVATYSTYIF